MSVSKFKFVSPGVFTKEVDLSQVPTLAAGIGPAIMGRSEKGPAFTPVQVESYDEFKRIFGEPIPGDGVQDSWRKGNYSGPTYAAYAAKAYLASGGPINFIRVLGQKNGVSTSNTTTALAGWQINKITTNSYGDGGAYGLYMVQSGTTAVSGTLGAVFYLETGSMALSSSTGGITAGYLHKSAGANSQFAAVIYDSSGNGVTSSFDMDPDSSIYIRKVFNTDPTTVTASINSTTKSYWLGESFSSQVFRTIDAGNASTGKTYGLLLPLLSGSSDSNRAGKNKMDYAKAATGWVFSQDFSDGSAFDPLATPLVGPEKLFKLHSLGGGEHPQRSYKISIANVKYSPNEAADPYGTFDVLVRRIDDFDHNPIVLERFSKVNLNPNSDNYIGRAIGTQYFTWDYATKRFLQDGIYENKSQYIRVQIDDNIKSVPKNALPFGFIGPKRFASWGQDETIKSGSANPGANVMAGNQNSMPTHVASATYLIRSDATHKFTASVIYPALPTRVDNTETSLATGSDAYWGMDTRRYAVPSGSTSPTNLYNEDIPDYLRSKANIGTAANLSDQMYFSLDDIASASTTSAPDKMLHTLTSRVNTSGSGDESITKANSSYKAVLDLDLNKFTMPLFGGFDGFDIKEREPLGDHIAGLDGQTEFNCYAYNTIKAAIDIIADPETIDINLASFPGVVEPNLTKHLLDTCEARGDALAIIDLEGGYTPATETSSAESARIGSVASTVTKIKTRKLNNSYGAAYYPWVTIKDDAKNSIVWVPPSVAALGALSYSEAQSEVWFAPAGFNRGGLSQGAAGIPVISVRDKVSSRDRDKLYEVNINPIASFPAEGLVIFGQKTLQANASALDRINVRRLMIFVKKQISRYAKGILFEQNVLQTWNRFTGVVEPFLESVKNGLGLTDYKLILDETTTTPDLQDRNVLYAKVYLKPARAIEYIALDFFITRSGASFEDL